MPDPQHISRVPSPIPTPIGSSRANSNQNTQTLFNGRSSHSKEPEDLVSALSRMNLSNGVKNQPQYDQNSNYGSSGNPGFGMGLYHIHWEHHLTEHEFLTPPRGLGKRPIRLGELDGTRVLHYENQIWSTTGGQDDMETVKNLPKGIRRDIKRYLCLDLVKKSKILKHGGDFTAAAALADEARCMDLADHYITLVHKGYELLEFLKVKASKKTLDWLQSKHLEVKLEQTINLEDVADGSKPYETLAGETIKADWIFLCLGKPLASSWLKNTILRDSLDANGSMIVDENLRVKGRKNIFAIEDIRNIKVSFYAL
ncbi:FAD/NAD(P)-binding oxidoreductase family protein [Tanacetum coccineum]